MLIKLKLTIYACLSVVMISYVDPAMRSKVVLVNEEQEQMIRQSQNTFVQWVESLLPQRPTYETLTSSTTTLATTTANVLESLNVTFNPEVVNITSKPLTQTITTTNTSIIANQSTHIPNASLPSTTTPDPIILNPPRNCTECVCGIANIQKRIVGGQETEVHQYPWMAMLLYGGRFYCAGSLINDQYVVTASHCIYGFRRERISVRLLEHDRKMSGIHKIDRKVVEIITHPKYNARTYDNDIAIVQLEKPVEMTELLHPVCMPTPGKSFKGETGIVTGWGALNVGGPTSDTLQEVHVPIMSQEDCRQSRYGASRITDNMLCAGFNEGKRDSCQGDSGGPLHIVSAGTREHQLAGVVSWGEGCAKAGYPGVYARVNRYNTWIRSMSKNACLCISEAKQIKK